MTHLFQVIATVLNFMVVLFGLWAVASLTVKLIFMTHKSKSKHQPTKHQPTKRQSKLYVHNMADDQQE